jgi:two-component system, NarL family, nitrate/nitrite response regulator NarL
MAESLHDLRLLILAGDPLARAGLAALLARQPGCQVVGQAPADANLAAEVDAAQPDVVVWDLGWTPAGVLERLAEQSTLLPPVLALLPAEDAAASRASQAWRAGARGLLDRNALPEAILAAAHSLALGMVVLARDLASEMLLPAAPDLAVTSLVEPLTPRENEVLQLLAEGLTNRAIALRLGISEHTVKFHVNAILGKLAAQSRADAVMRATRLGLILL